MCCCCCCCCCWLLVVGCWLLVVVVVVVVVVVGSLIGMVIRQARYSFLSARYYVDIVSFDVSLMSILNHQEGNTPKDQGTVMNRSILRINQCKQYITMSDTFEWFALIYGFSLMFMVVIYLYLWMRKETLRMSHVPPSFARDTEDFLRMTQEISFLAAETSWCRKQTSRRGKVDLFFFGWLFHKGHK